MVIQCPDCGTKFSVESDELSTARNPVFHCSRCNHLFDLRGRRRSGAESEQDESLTGAEEKQIVSKKEPPKETTQLDLLSETAPGQPSPEWSTRSSLLDEDEDGRLPLITAEWPDEHSDREVEVNLGEVTRKTTPFAKTLVGATAQKIAEPRIPEPKITETLVKQIEPEPQEIPAVPTLALGEDFLDEEDLLLTPRTTFLEKFLDSRDEELAASTGQPLPMTATQPMPAFVDLMPPDFANKELHPLAAQPMTASATQPMIERTIALKSLLEKSSGDLPPTFLRGAVVPFPPLSGQRSASISGSSGFSGGAGISEKKSLLAGLSAARAASPSWARSFVTAICVPFVLTSLYWAVGSYGSSLTGPLAFFASSDLPRVAPEGFEIQSLRSSVKVLNDGQKAIEILGNLVNATPKSYKNIFVVARSFDSQNHKLSEVVLPAVNGLQNVDTISSLKTEMLRRIQSEPGLAKPLKPTDAVPFRAVLLVDGTTPSYFDTRVYSVERVQG